MAKGVQTRSALRDLDGIWDYIAEDNPAKASDVIRTHGRQDISKDDC